MREVIKEEFYGAISYVVGTTSRAVGVFTTRDGFTGHGWEVSLNYKLLGRSVGDTFKTRYFLFSGADRA